jgi:hypothetical protein
MTNILIQNIPSQIEDRLIDMIRRFGSCSILKFPELNGTLSMMVTYSHSKDANELISYNGDEITLDSTKFKLEMSFLGQKKRKKGSQPRGQAKSTKAARKTALKTSLPGLDSPSQIILSMLNNDIYDKN